MTIEDIILSNSTRGMSQLRRSLPPDFCRKAASYVLESEGPVMILTGFYVAPGYETDGPIGALVIGRALEKLKRTVHYVTDGSADMMRELVGGPEDQVIEFPVMGHERSQKRAREILSDLQPGLAVAVERCGLTEEKRYLNMHGKDISDKTAKLDYLFAGVERTVAIGDGGNEIGMGSVRDAMSKVSIFNQESSNTSTEHLVIASVSNWGAFGLVGYMSLLSDKNLLPSVKKERAMVKKWVDMGGVDGLTGEQLYAVDGFTLEQNSDILARVQGEIASNGHHPHR